MSPGSQQEAGPGGKHGVGKKVPPPYEEMQVSLTWSPLLPLSPPPAEASTCQLLLLLSVSTQEAWALLALGLPQHTAALWWLV